MKRMKSLLAVALVLSTSIGSFASRSEETRRVRLQELRASTSSHIHVTLLERAFLDAVAILEKQNSCSEFFGGSKAADVLKELVANLETRSNDYRVGVQMSGRFVVYKHESGVLYRLFEKAEVNRSGPFYKAKVFPSEPLIPKIGSFPPNTRQVRVLILLHELAHLIEGGNRTWLIPDDGNNEELSRSNTRTIESKCSKEIRAL